MRITTNLETPLKNLDGTNLKVMDFKDGVVVETTEAWTLGRAITNALIQQPEEKIEGIEKVKRGKLAFDLYGKKGSVSLEVEQVNLIKDLCGKAYGPLMVYQIYQMIDPAEEPEKEPEAEPIVETEAGE